MISLAAFMDLPTRYSPRRQSPAEEEAEEIAGRILAVADFVEWRTTTTLAGDHSSVQVWRLRKPIAGYAAGSLVTRDELVRIFTATRRK